MRLPRMWDWIVTMILMLIMVYIFAPQQLMVVMYKVALVSIAACMTYWIDRSLFKRAADRINSRDMVSLHADVEVVRHAANVIRRALIFVGCVLGLSLGV